MSPVRPLGIGLLGLGTVGSAVARTVAERSRLLDQAAGRPLRLVAAAVRDPARPRDAAEVPITADPFAILDDPEIEIVVEVIGGIEPARDLHLAAFERGKHVVTANKELVAKEWEALHEAARQAKRQLRFEAAVAAAVPVIAAARTLGASRTRTVRGLLNGTSTFICSRMQGGASFDDALAEAQRAGYAEADPSNDVDGLDAAYKLCILLNILGHRTSPDDVRRTTLRGVTQAAMESAAGRGKAVRSLAIAELDGKRVSARVGPEEVDLASLEGSAAGPTNVVTFETDLAGTLTLTGPGAGGPATASAVLGDIIAIARGR
ncbi:MAG TPA: homoserine dehydrogenase [Candidatus Limnocylindria bacterium]|nr:homoserine dehydrogenase [Candidatus Limnocylindria bacterium]